MAVCTKQDEFNREKVCWVAHLSNGETVYQDDDRPGETERSSWIRLKNYCKQGKYSVVGIDIRFWDHKEKAVTDGALGYYFVNKVEATAFSGVVNNTHSYYVIGYLKDDKVYTTEWLVPEIIEMSHEIRDVVADDPKLIINQVEFISG